MYVVVLALINGHVLHLGLLQLNAPGGLGVGFLCLALTSMSRRFLERRYDTNGSDLKISLHRLEECKMLMLLCMSLFMCGSAGLNVITNGVLSVDLVLTVGLRAWLRDTKWTLCISSVMNLWLYPLLLRYVVSSLVRLVNNSSLEQMRRRRRAMLYGSERLVCDG